MIVLPLLLAAAIWLWHRWRIRPNDEAPPFRPCVVIALSFLAVWSHPLLDWLNTYGVRLLMPFDGRWFYGDTLFIVDPWLWLLAAAGVVLARSKSYPAIAGWIVLGVLTSVLILNSEYAPTGVKLVWMAALAMLGTLCWRMRTSAFDLTLARASTAALVVYICSAYGMARVAESRAVERFPAQQVQSNPVPGLPYSHRIVLADDTGYRVIAVDGNVYEMAREEPDHIVRAAMASESIRGFANWTRFPYWKVEETADSWVVRFWDLRYQGPDAPGAGIGFAEVEVPKERTRGK
jgi:inner membrane protein